MSFADLIAKKSGSGDEWAESPEHCEAGNNVTVLVSEGPPSTPWSNSNGSRASNAPAARHRDRPRLRSLPATKTALAQLAQFGGGFHNFA